MRLVDYLKKEYTTKELKKFACALHMEKYSLLRKDALADEIVKKWCAKDFLRTRLETLTDEEMEIFRKACVKPQEIRFEFIIDSMNLVAAMVGDFDPETDCFCVYEEIKEAFAEIDDEDLRRMQRKKGRLTSSRQEFLIWRQWECRIGRRMIQSILIEGCLCSFLC